MLLRADRPARSVLLSHSGPTRVAGRKRRALFGFAVRVAALGLGLGLGVLSAFWALRQDGGIGAVAVGPWRTMPGEGTPRIDPYRRALFARTGEVPMAAAQGLAMKAYRDDSGRKLQRACGYRVGGTVPKARFWTLGVVDLDGHSLPNAADRYAFTSESVLRDQDGGFSVSVTPEPSPGNWLPLTGRGRFVLVLRLYETATVAFGTRDLGALSAPTIKATGPC